MEVTCPACGNTFEVAVRRHNKRGEGLHDAKEKIKKLARGDRLCLQVIDETHAVTPELGFTKSEMTFKVNEIRHTMGLKNVLYSTVSCHLSRLQGLGILSCKPADVTLVNPITHEFTKDGTPRWYRVGSSLLENQP